MRLCELEYETYTDANGNGSVLKRCIPHDGVWLYEIMATYARQHPSSTYYYLGRTKREALLRFQDIMGAWMTVTSIRLIPPGNEAESILTDMLKMPLR